MFRTIRNNAAFTVCALLCAACLTLLLCFPDQALSGAKQGLLLCGQVVIPSLFPFTALMLLIQKSGLARLLGKAFAPVSRFLWGLDGEAGAVVLLSFCGGYPVGARLIGALYEDGNIELPLARRMLYFSVNAGPAFILAAVGAGMFRSLRAGLLLYAAHLLASVLLGVALCRVKADARTRRPSPSKAPLPRVGDAFVEATADASGSILGICAWVILFSTASALLACTGLPVPVRNAVCALSEVTCGAALLAKEGRLVITAALLGFSGLCVHCQVLSAARKLKLRYGAFFLARLAHGALAAGLTWLGLQLFPGILPAPNSVPAISNGVSFQSAATGVSLPAAAGLLLTCIVLLLSIGDRRAPRRKQ